MVYLMTRNDMSEDTKRPVDADKARALLEQKRKRMKLSLAACAGCTLCAESCFMFMSHGENPKYMPSYKVLNSLGMLYRKKGRVSDKQLENMKDLIWKNCVLCGRCYCPLGIDLPSMIAFARRILREQGVPGVYPHSLGEPEENGQSSVNDAQDALDKDGERE